jgi:hypothetical protein
LTELDGIVTAANPFLTAFRTRVSMSAIGSLVGISNLAPSPVSRPDRAYQLAFLMPGISPRLASFLRQHLHTLNLL